VFINLLTISMHATPAGGTIRIGTKILPELKKVQFFVADSGEGIPPENIGKVFDPFFTTKRPGKGIGLGLSIVQRIISNHNGRIWVESTPGKGATFTAELPSA